MTPCNCNKLLSKRNLPNTGQSSLLCYLSCICHRRTMTSKLLITSLKLKQRHVNSTLSVRLVKAEDHVTVVSWTEITVLPIEAITWILSHNACTIEFNIEKHKLTKKLTLFNVSWCIFSHGNRISETSLTLDLIKDGFWQFWQCHGLRTHDTPGIKFQQNLTICSYIISTNG